jgi:hypothetical protein
VQLILHSSHESWKSRDDDPLDGDDVTDHVGIVQLTGDLFRAALDELISGDRPIL